MPEGVTGIRMSGRLRGDDLRQFKAATEELLKTGEIRIVEVVAPDYEGFGPGGLIEDLKLPARNRRLTGARSNQFHGPANNVCRAYSPPRSAHVALVEAAPLLTTAGTTSGGKPAHDSEDYRISLGVGRP